MGSYCKTRTTNQDVLLCLHNSSDAGLVSHPNGAVVPQYTPEVTAARLQHLQALQADVKEDKRGRGLDLALLLGLGLKALAGPRAGAGYSSGGCDTKFCQLCTESGACRKNCGPVCRRKCC